MWDAIRAETNGRVEATVYPENNKLAGGDPAALKMLIAGEIQFFTLMGGIIGTVVPVAEAQQVPFAFKSAAEAHKAIDGPLGAYIGEEMAAKGMYLFPVAGFDNGMRQVAGHPLPSRSRTISPGVKIRVPPGQMIFDTFQAFGAEPVTTPANLIYDSLKTGKVGAQENPLAILEGFKIYEVVKYVSMTNHMWSGFNADGASRDLEKPARRHQDGDRPATSPNSCASSARSRASSTPACAADFETRGLVFNEVDQAPFRAKLPRRLRDLEGQARHQVLGRCSRRRLGSWGSASRGGPSQARTRSAHHRSLTRTATEIQSPRPADRVLRSASFSPIGTSALRAASWRPALITISAPTICASITVNMTL